MYWLVGLMTASLVGIMALGVYLEFRPLTRGSNGPGWLKGTLGVNLLTFVLAEIGLLVVGMQDVLAQPAAAAAGAAPEISVGMGLALIGTGIPTALATIGAGIAVGPVGAAALAVIAEKPEVFGRSLIYLGLAEGIAIYGLVVTILMLGRLG
ncbi:ATP synthase subunit C [Thioalbus denitrificans]|uniref:ATP synthase F(0) sector subunit c n=1 Tax=Thioalbus denitrificans TaxID=547122 RepID=A0A369BY06_9GAMM|nr:ATP synthase subunit C [Thioalbus denitrificans]RCX26592.1 V/A-type H+-transporting ATPase subunit K [Thioalbus denitrificans]